MRFLHLPLVLFLASCASMSANNQITAAANREAAAWSMTTTEADQKCTQSKREDALKKYDCVTNIIEKNVRPIAFNHDQLNGYLLAMRKTSLAYKNGKIDKDSAQIQAQENWNRYIANLNQISQGMMTNAQQQDQRLSQGLAQMSNQANQMEMQRMQSMNNNMPKTTNCRYIGNSLNCTTW